MSTSQIVVGERRQGPDRRKRPTPMWSRYTLRGRRRSFRRAGEARNAYVDRYGSRLLAVLTMIAALCVLDAVFTLLYLQRGGTELNPIMALAISSGVATFLIVKCGLTFLGVVFLGLHKNFRGVTAILGVVLLIYCALTGYHLYLASL